MDTILFNTLNLQKNEDIKILKINEQEIKVKQYLPIQDKLNLIRDAIVNSQDNNEFYDGVKLELHCTLQIIYYYTNLEFTAEELEHEDEIYDLLESNGIINQIFEIIPEEETNLIMNGAEELMMSMKTFSFSALGILESLKRSYQNAELDLSQLTELIKDPEQFKFIQNMLNNVN